MSFNFFRQLRASCSIPHFLPKRALQKRTSKALSTPFNPRDLSQTEMQRPLSPPQLLTPLQPSGLGGEADPRSPHAPSILPVPSSLSPPQTPQNSVGASPISPSPPWRDVGSLHSLFNLLGPRFKARWRGRRCPRGPRC